MRRMTSLECIKEIEKAGATIRTRVTQTGSHRITLICRDGRIVQSETLHRFDWHAAYIDWRTA